MDDSLVEFGTGEDLFDAGSGVAKDLEVCGWVGDVEDEDYCLFAWDVLVVA